MCFRTLQSSDCVFLWMFRLNKDPKNLTRESLTFQVLHVSLFSNYSFL